MNCPITGDRFVDPVIAADGHSYERSAIEEWFRLGHRTSPLTNLPLDNLTLKPNHALRNLLDDLTKKEAAPPPAAAAAAAVSFTRRVGTAAAASTAPPRTAPVAASTTSNDVDVLVRDMGAKGKLVEISPKAGRNGGLPLFLVCVLDISGSMGLAAQRNATGAVSEASKFSRLDLVKHSMKVVASLLSDGDMISLIVFSDNASVLAQQVKMDEVGKQTIATLVDDLAPLQQTNLWAGLQFALREVTSQTVPGYNNSVLVFTDGEPTSDYTPPKGILEEYIKKIAPSKDMFSLHTCGYGFSLQTDLLVGLAQASNGGFYYIPDGSMVGTIFINLMANLLDTCRTDITVNGKRIGNLFTTRTRHIWLPPDGRNENGTRVTVAHDGFSGDFYASTYDYTEEYDFQVDRKTFLDMLEKLVVPGLKAQPKLDAPKFVSNVKQAFEIDFVSNDADKGQVTKATEFYTTWGKNYLASIYLSHLREEAANFKDATMEFYHSPEFDAHVENGNTVFLLLPPPKPSLDYYGDGGAVSSSSFASSFNNPHGPCFSGNSLVSMANGLVKALRSILPGDVLSNGAKVEKVLVFHRTSKALILSQNCRVTPYHPVMVEDVTDITGMNWSFPIDVFPNASTCIIPEVYNLVLDKTHIVCLDGKFNFCTLGHGFSGNSVISHPFFGNRDAILRCIADKPGFVEGVVHLSGEMERSEVTGLVTRFL